MKEPKVIAWNELSFLLKKVKPVPTVEYTLSPKDNGLAKITDAFILTGKYVIMSRTVFQGVNFNLSGITATNTHKLLFIPGKTKYNNKTFVLSEKKTIYTKGDEIKDTYPSISEAVPKQVKTTKKVHLLALRTFLKAAIDGKFIDKPTNLVKCFVDDYVIGFNAQYLLDCCDGLLKLGIPEGYALFQDNTYPVVLSPMMGRSHLYDYPFTLIMPLYLDTIDQQSPMQTNNDNGLFLDAYWDFNRNAIVSAKQVIEIETSKFNKKTKLKGLTDDVQRYKIEGEFLAKSKQQKEESRKATVKLNADFEARQNELAKYLSKEERAEYETEREINHIIEKAKEGETLTSKEVNFLNENSFLPDGFQYDKHGELERKIANTKQRALALLKLGKGKMLMTGGK